MNVGEEIFIRNTKGILKVKLEQKLRLSEVMTGNGSDRLPAMTHPCLGFHQRGSEDIITLLDEKETEQFPTEVFLGFWEPSGIEVWKGRIAGPEETDAIYTTFS